MSQHMEALALAERTRMGGVQVRKELRTHQITLAEALEDGRAAHLPVNRLLCAMLGWGPVRTDSLLIRAGVWQSKRVDTLTERQRREIVKRVAR